MASNTNDIQISSKVGEALSLSPYFPTVFSTGQKNEGLEDLNIDIITTSVIENTVDSIVDSILSEEPDYFNNDVLGDYKINLDLFKQ